MSWWQKAKRWAIAALALAGIGCTTAVEPATEGTSIHSAPQLSPALLSGTIAPAIDQLQSELRVELDQPRLLLREDAFQSFHRITLAPLLPAAATDRLREPGPQVELLTDGSGCWLRLVGQNAWPVDGIECVRYETARD